MKKLMTMILALSVAIGASTLLLAQEGKDAPKEAPKDGKGGKGKGKGGKAGDAPADTKGGEKGKAPETK